MRTTFGYKIKKFIRRKTCFLLPLKIKFLLFFDSRKKKNCKNSETPRISVIIPTFNSKKYLKEAIDSILWQTYTDFEVLIVDDSNDDTKKIIQKYKDKRIKLIEGERKGIAAALNLGLKNARGEYIARMDADDISMPKRFEEQINFLDTHPDVGACFIEPKLFGTYYNYWEVRHDTQARYRTGLLFQTTVCHPTVMFRRKEFEDKNLKYDNEFKYYEDFELWSRAIKKVKFHCIKKNLFLYRIYGNNSCIARMDISKLYAYKIIKRNLKEYLGYDIDDLTLSSLWWKEPVEFNQEEISVITEKYCEILDAIAKHPDYDYETALKHLSSLAKKDDFEFSREESEYRAKIIRNCTYIENNKEKTLKNLQNKVKHKKLNVVFYVYDETKWKCQSVYDLLEKSENFIPHIFVTKNAAPKENFNCQKPESLAKVYNFFKDRDMRVHYAWDFVKNNYIAFKDMEPKPDIIIYQHPWYVETSQGPVVCSEFALTYYIPYYISTQIRDIEYKLRFHQYIQAYYVKNDAAKQYMASKMKNCGKNLRACGHPTLDYFFINKDKEYENKKYVIYAPHWSVGDDNTLKLSTFDWSGKFILDYARKHPGIKWVFKPHPCLYSYLINKNIMTKEEVDNYWADWSKIGQVNESGDYLKMFMESSAMITDCDSFLVEYFYTKKPLIHLNRGQNMQIYDFMKQIIRTYYSADNRNELKRILDNVIIKNNDKNKILREKVLEESQFAVSYAAQNIIDDIKNDLGLNSIY